MTNVLLIVSDQHRRDASGAYESKVRRRDGSSPTPNIDKLAARGTVFDRATCNSPLCAPSRASYLTGLHPHTTTALYHKMLEREAGLTRFPGVRKGVKTIADHFRAAGYRTGAIGKMHVHGEEARGWDLGFDVRELRFYTQAPGMHYNDINDGDVNHRYREMPPYRDLTYREIDPRRFANAPPDLKVRDNTLNQHLLETLVEREEDMFDHLVADRSIDFIDACGANGKPFFLHVGLEKPHEPWSVHRKYLDLFDPESIPLPATVDDWRERGWYPGIPAWQHANSSPDDIRRIIASYYACVAEMDHELGRVIDHCANLGLLDDTVIVYTSDHGELLFDHGLIYKHNFFASSVDVPLVMAGPGIPFGKRADAPASLIDLLPTLLELAGLRASPDAEGMSLRDAARTPRPLFSEFHQAGSAAWGPRLHPTRMVQDGPWKYIYTHGMRDQLFDTAADPLEMHDLAADPAQTDTLSRLRYLCLRDWELDAHPQLTIRADRRDGEMHLSWEPAGDGATYDVWREPNDGSPELLLKDLPAPHTELPDIGAHRYRVIAHLALTRTYTDPHGRQRYGEIPVLASEYPDFLPITPVLELDPQHESAEARYQPWHSVDIEGQHWIYEGMPPRVGDGHLTLAGPCAFLTPRFITGDFLLSLEDISTAWKKDVPPDEQVLEVVFGWDNAACAHAFVFDASGMVRLVSRTPGYSVLAEAHAEALTDLTFKRVGATATLSNDGQPIISHDLPGLLDGRVGLNLGLGVETVTARIVFETNVAGDGDATVM